MKSKIIFFVVLIIAGLVIYGYFQAVPGNEDSAISLPRIEINPKEFDFGVVKHGEIVEFVFRVKNAGKEVLEIRKLATSCACTTVQASQEILEPGAEADLLVIYNTGAMSGSHARGDQERIIYIRSNDPVDPQIEVKIYANVK